MNNKNLFLTSVGLSLLSFEKYFADFVKKNLPHTDLAVIIPNASPEGALGKYNAIAKKQLENLGFKEVRFLDVTKDDIRDLLPADLVYVSGGNTFKLLHDLRGANGLPIINAYINKGGCYLGVSAGAIILSDDISAAAEIDADENFVNLTELQALGEIDFHVVPHYEACMDGEIASFKKRNKCKVLTISNNQAFHIANKNIYKIQQGTVSKYYFSE